MKKKLRLKRKKYEMPCDHLSNIYSHCIPILTPTTVALFRTTITNLSFLFFYMRFQHEIFQPYPRYHQVGVSTI